MSELVGVLIRGVLVLVGHVVYAINPYELLEGRRRRRRLASLARGERVEIPCVLKDPVLTGGRHQEGRLSVRDPPVTWRAKGREEPAVFSPGPLNMAAVDEMAVTFRSEDERTELRLHPDEAAPVLRAIGSPPAP